MFKQSAVELNSKGLQKADHVGSRMGFEPSKESEYKINVLIQRLKTATSYFTSRTCEYL